MPIDIGFLWDTERSAQKQNERNETVIERDRKTTAKKERRTQGWIFMDKTHTFHSQNTRRTAKVII